MTTDVSIDSVNITSSESIELDGTSSTTEPCIQNKEGVVEGYKKEYSIVGDGLYASVSAENAPQWLNSIIDSVIDVQLQNGLLDLEEARNSILAALDEIDVAKNQYQELINIEATIDGIITSKLETLNATVADTTAEILRLDAAKVTSEEATAIVTEQISAELLSGDIRSEINRIDLAVSDTNSSFAATTESLESNLALVDVGVEANATATNSLQTYVGIDAAGASTGTGLSAYLEGSDGSIGSADSRVTNGVYVDSLGNPTSILEYSSVLIKDGVYYNAGFGLNLSANSGTGTELDPFDSEFWVNAEKFKFTNGSQTGQVAPFTIDASGITPQITFNGVVDFTSTNSSGTTTIDGSKITTGTLDANRITAGTLKASQLVASNDGSTTWSGGGLVSSNFNGNSYGDIGNPTFGFRLSSDAIGSDKDPNIYGAFIKGGEINGAIIRGASIIFTQQLRATAAGEPFYSYGIPSTSEVSINSAFPATTSWAYNTLPEFGFYPYNALPNGLEEPDHFMSEAITINVIGGATINTGVGFPTSMKGARIDIYSSNGTLLSTPFNYNGGNTWSVTQNGITISRSYEVVGKNDDGDNLYSYTISISGSCTVNFNGYNNEKLKIRLGFYRINGAFFGPLVNGVLPFTASTSTG